jgi:hypothetical protein
MRMGVKGIYYIACDCIAAVSSFPFIAILRENDLRRFTRRSHEEEAERHLLPHRRHVPAMYVAIQAVFSL